MIKDYHNYLIALDISPKDGDPSIPVEWVSELLNLAPTDITKKGTQIGNTKFTYDRWYWRYSTPSIDFQTSELSFSKELIKFLNQLPKEQMVWDKLHEKCDADIYFPIERDHFQIEVDIDSNVSRELSMRNLTFKFSALFKEEEK